MVKSPGSYKLSGRPGWQAGMEAVEQIGRPAAEVSGSNGSRVVRRSSVEAMEAREAVDQNELSHADGQGVGGLLLLLLLLLLLYYDYYTTTTTTTITTTTTFA